MGNGDALPRDWPREADLLPLAEVEAECIRDGIAEHYHRTMAAAYGARKKPVTAAVFWGTSMVHVAVQNDDGGINYTSVFYKPVDI